MVLRENENIIMKVRAETMFFSLIRCRRYTLVLTDQRILLTSIFGIKKEYELGEIDSIEPYKVTFFLPFGIRFHLHNDEKLELAIVARKSFVNAITNVCPQIALTSLYS